MAFWYYLISCVLELRMNMHKKKYEENITHITPKYGVNQTDLLLFRDQQFFFLSYAMYYFSDFFFLWFFFQFIFEYF